MPDKRKYWLADGAPGQNAFFEAALDPALWEKGGKEDWDVCWRVAMPKPALFKELKPGQSVNHLPGNGALTIKDRLFKTLAAHRDRLAGGPEAGRLGFFPEVYDMPGQYHALQTVAHADPGALWMLKPKRLSRGRGVELLKDPALAPLDSAFMVQSYLDRPHLFDGRKYVMRRYVAITSVEPLRAWLFEDGFVKLASEAYDETALDNPFAYLTNPDINALNERVEAPVVFKSLPKYRAWLREAGHDADKVFDAIEDMMAVSVIAAREEMRTRGREAGGDLSNCFELLGFDCMVDADLKPWLLECNLSPSLDVCADAAEGGEDEAEAKRRMVADLVELTGLNEPSQRSKDPVARAEAERAKAGGWSLLVPSADLERTFSVFPTARLADRRHAEALFGAPPPVAAFQADRIEPLVREGALSLVDARTGAASAPNDTAALFWLALSDGASPDAAAEDVASAAGLEDVEPVRVDAWNLAADWARDGWLRPATAPSPNAVAPAAAGPPARLVADIGAGPVRIRVDAPEVAGRLAAFARPAKGDEGEALDEIRVARADRGYAVLDEAGPARTGLTLARVAPELLERLQARLVSAAAGGLAVDSALLTRPDGALWLVAGGVSIGWDAAALALGAVAGGVTRLGPSAGEASAAPAPFRTDLKSASTDADASGVHLWTGGAKGRLRRAGGGSAAGRVAAVVFIEQSDEPSLKRLTAAEALSLAAGRLLPGGAAPGRARTIALADWLTGVPAIRAEAPDALAAAKLLVDAQATPLTPAPALE